MLRLSVPGQEASTIFRRPFTMNIVPVTSANVRTENRRPSEVVHVCAAGWGCVRGTCVLRQTHGVTSDLRSDSQLEFCFSVRTALRFEHAGFVLEKAHAAVRQRAVDIAVKIAAMVASMKACLIFYLKCQRRVLRLLVLASVKRRSPASQLSNKQKQSIRERFLQGPNAAR